MSDPIYIEADSVSYFDCDDTLIMHDKDKPGDVNIKDPYNLHEQMLVRKHERHIKLLKEHKARGRCIVVWSAAGAPWAKAVVEALELNSYVDLIISKPICFIDDLPANEILGTRIYLKED